MFSKNSRKVIIFGIGVFGKKLLHDLRERWEIIAVDFDEKNIEELSSKYKNYKNITFIKGDASSILTWKKINLQNLSSIISTIQDKDVALEICRIGREAFKISKDTPFIVLLIDSSSKKDFERYNVEIIEPADIVSKKIVSLVEKNFYVAINIGLGKGEIVQTEVRAPSHLVERKLKYIKSTRWRVAAIYRDNKKFILPTPEDVIKVKDKVVIVGYPSVVESIVNIFLKGIPQFPLQFGNNIAVPFNKDYTRSLEEAEYLRKNSKAHKLLIFPYKKFKRERDIPNIEEKLDKNFFEIKEKLSDLSQLFYLKKHSIGLVIIPFTKPPFFKGMFLKEIFKRATKPFLISRATYPYEKILVSLNSFDPVFSLEIGMEFSRISKIPIEVIYVAKPKKLRGIEDRKKLDEMNGIVNDFRHIYNHINIKYTVLEGNPVRKTEKYIDKLDKNLLLIMSYDKNDTFSIFNPNTQYLTTKKVYTSVLLLPVGKKGEALDSEMEQER